MAFEAKDHPISKILDKAVFDIPRNQRRYVWKKENWNDLFEDLVFSIAQNKPHFVGSIVLGKQPDIKDGLDYYTVIDGQQRLTTITLLLVAIMKHFHENSMMDEFWGTISYMQSKNNRNKDVVIMQSEYHTSIESLVKGIIGLNDKDQSVTAFVNSHIPSTASKDKCIAEAIKFFYAAIEEDLKSTEKIHDRLVSIRTALLDMTVVKIVSTSEEDSYTIFEILNARGQELVAHELLKNYIMRYIQPVERRDDAKQTWNDIERTIGTAMDKFVKHYATHRFGDTRDKYSSPYQAIQKATRGQDIGKLFDDIVLKSQYYQRIIHPSGGEDGNCSDIEFEIFNFFRVKRLEQFRPILLSLIHQNELEKLNRERYEASLKFIYNFFVCYTIIGEEKSNKLEDVVFKYARSIELAYSDDLLDEFAKSLKKKLPSFEWFQNAFKNIGWSNHHDLYKGNKNKDRVQLILEVVERYRSQSHSLNDFTIEHILPDSEGIENAQIGNLIPLEERLNSRCARMGINKKLEIYCESGFASARGTAQRYKDKDFNPAERTKFLAKLIYNNILELNQYDYSKD